MDLTGDIVALTVTPADGFISRLIQQTHQAASSRVPGHSHQSVAKQDQTSISQEARQATHHTDNQQLESRLIDLYNQKGKSAG